jgi:hypothetical protein
MDRPPSLAPGMQIGDYLLKELISEGSATRTWYAEQISVRREVIVDSLRSAILQNDTVREAFLEDVRAKARVDHPLIGSVFEAIKLQNACFYARERLAGETLEHYVERGQKLSPATIVHMLSQIAEANLHLEQNNIGSIPIGPHQIYIGDKFLTRLVNMAIGEQRDHSVSTADKAMLGRLFKEMVDRSAPGATRVNSLCDFMTDIHREVPITWSQISELSQQVEKQLREKPVIAGQDLVTVSLNDKVVMRNSAIVIVATVIILIFVGLITFFIVRPKPTFPRDLSQMKVIDVDSVRVNGADVEMVPFYMDLHEVTIAEYAEFLKVVERDGTHNFTPASMPSSELSFYPGGEKTWRDMHKAAQEGLGWKGRTMGLNQPVFFVNYWCAQAYAMWKSYEDGNFTYSVPAEAHYLAVLQSEKAENLKAGVWGDVDVNNLDITAQSGIHGLAGGVSEWTSSTTTGVDDRHRLPILWGASFSQPDGGAKDKETVSSPGLIRENLGFRLIKEEKR